MAVGMPSKLRPDPPAHHRQLGLGPRAHADRHRLREAEHVAVRVERAQGDAVAGRGWSRWPLTFRFQRRSIEPLWCAPSGTRPTGRDATGRARAPTRIPTVSLLAQLGDDRARRSGATGTCTLQRVEEHAVRPADGGLREQALRAAGGGERVERRVDVARRAGRAVLGERVGGAARGQRRRARRSAARAALERVQADAARRVGDERAGGVEVPDEAALVGCRCVSVQDTYGVLPKNVMSGVVASCVRRARPGCRR